MRKKKWIFVAGPAALALLVFIGGEAVMLLWNWLLPPLFGWPQVSFWQAVGLLALCRILFGHFGGGSHGPAFRRQGKRWEKMTPEEREKFREQLRRHAGMDEPGEASKEPA